MRRFCEKLSYLFVAGLLLSSGLAGVKLPKAQATSGADDRCNSLTSSGYLQGFGEFQGPVTITGPGTGMAVYRTYVCNGTDDDYDDTTITLNRGVVEETGLANPFDYSTTGWTYNAAGPSWTQPMGVVRAHSTAYRDVNVLVDGSKFAGTGTYHIDVTGAGQVCNLRAGWCGYTNVGTYTLELQIISTPSVEASCGPITFSPVAPSPGSTFTATANLTLTSPTINSGEYPASVEVDKPDGTRVTYPWNYIRDSLNPVITFTTPGITDTAGTFTVHARLSGPTGFTPLDCTATLNGGAASVTHPYVQFRRGDVWTGGKFGKFDATTGRDVVDPAVGSCGLISAIPLDKPGNIKASGHGPDASQVVGGSFGEYGVFANGDVDFQGTSGNQNFFSQVLTKPGSPATITNQGKGLSFGNQGSTVGQFGANQCIHDYYGQLSGQPATDPGASINVTSLADGLYKHTGTVHLTAPAWLNNKHLTLLVDGDVIIDTNVDLTDASGSLAGGASISEQVGKLSSLLVVAKGNILVKSGVTALDGLWVAQPKGSFDTSPTSQYQTSGIIDDCIDPRTNLSFPDTSSGALRQDCGDAGNLDGTGSSGRLVVNGGLTARKIRLRRLAGDVSHNGAGTAANPYDTRDTTHAAENISLGPESLFTSPVGTGSSLKYDSIEILPPVL